MTYCFEQGPIRPPSEARSLLLRLTRNCPWNRCTFCPVYKGARFSVRPVEHVKKDIDLVHKYIRTLHLIAGRSGRISRTALNRIAAAADSPELPALYAAHHWLYRGRMRSVFLQDANSLVMKPHLLKEVLGYLTMRFPSVERITSYARSHTIARIEDSDLLALRHAGLNRLHVGLESGSDEILSLVHKGATREIHIQAGRKVKRAGIELSEYYMPGLGGNAHYQKHALESADALNRINPDFIRLRTLAIPASAPLYEEYSAGRFDKCSEAAVARELLLFLESLDGITSYVVSDHVLNLFPELEGRLPADKPRMTGIVRAFLEMERERQIMYQAGRRLGVFGCLADMDQPDKFAAAREACAQYGITAENADEMATELMQQFI